MKAQVEWMQLATVLMPTLLIVFVALFSKNHNLMLGNNTIFRIVELGLLSIAVEHFWGTGQLKFAGLFIFIMVFIGVVFWMENRIFSKQFIDFFEDKVIIPGSIFNRTLRWKQIDKVILNQNYLTIELKNNAFHQNEIIDSFTPEERTQFHYFCQQRTQPQA